MNGNEISKLFERLGRLVSATKQNAGNGTEWDYTFPNRETHHYVIHGLKSHAEVEDNAFSLLIWIWNAKDYLKKRAVAVGKSGQIVEDTINNDADLAVCGDLANHIKHGGLDRPSRSGLKLRFGQVSLQAPQTAIGSLTFRALEVELQIDDPSQIEFRFPVINEQDEDSGDVFTYAERAIRSLERLRDEIEGRV